MRTNIWFLKGLKKLGRTEKFPEQMHNQVEQQSIINKNVAVKKFGHFNRSFYLYPIDSGTCGACNLELHALQTPHYDFNRLGLFFTNSPRHADALLIMGVDSEMMEMVLKKAYEAMPEPKLIIALGDCSVKDSIVGKNPKLSEEAIVSIPGCPPNPYTILNGIINAKEVFSR